MSHIYLILEANSSWYVDEIQQKLFEAQDVNVSIATISHAIKKLAVSNNNINQNMAPTPHYPLYYVSKSQFEWTLLFSGLFHTSNY